MLRPARQASRSWSATPERDIDIWSSVMARSIRAAGGRTGMIIHNAYGYGLFTGGLGVHYGAEQLGCTVVPISGGMTERQVQLINDFRPDIITVTPSYMLAILDEFKRRGLDPRKSSLKFGIFGAEPWTNAMRAEIEDAFDMDATDIYGLSEVIGPGVAQECVETKDGLHIWEDHFYPEVIDPETGAGAARRREGRAGLHLAHQGRLSGDPLSHPRPDAAAAGHGAAGHAADGEGHRPLRRHDHPARRQRVPDPDRGAAAGDRLVRRPFHHRADPRGPDGRDGRPSPRRARSTGTAMGSRNMPRRSPPSSRTPSASARRSGSSRRRRWSARSARPSVFTTGGRKGNSCPRNQGIRNHDGSPKAGGSRSPLRAAQRQGGKRRGARARGREAHAVARGQ